MEKNWRWAEQSGTWGRALLYDSLLMLIPPVRLRFVRFGLGELINSKFSLTFTPCNLPQACLQLGELHQRLHPPAPDIVWALGPFGSTALAGPATPHFLYVLLCLLTAPIHGSFPQPQTFLHLLVKFLCPKPHPAGRLRQSNSPA